MTPYFSRYYYLSEKRMSLLRRFTNLFTTNKKIDLNVDKLQQFGEIDGRAFKEVVEKMSQVLVRPKRKYYGKEAEEENAIIEIYNGILKGQNKKKLLPNAYTSQNVAVYETREHGVVAAILVTDGAGNDRYYVGVDRKGNKFFKEITGMLVSTFVVINKPDPTKRVDADTLDIDVLSRIDIEPEEPKEAPKPETSVVMEPQEDYMDFLEKLSGKGKIPAKHDPLLQHCFVKVNKNEYGYILSQINRLGTKLKEVQQVYAPVGRSPNTFNRYVITGKYDYVVYLLKIDDQHYFIYEAPTGNRLEFKNFQLENKILKNFYDPQGRNAMWFKDLDIDRLPAPARIAKK